MDSVSAHSTAEAVSIEGASWGMSARIVGDAVKVCDEIAVCVVESGVAVILDMQRPLCTVDEDHPFSGALRNRVDNGETDLAARARSYDAVEKKRQQRAMDETDARIKDEWLGRKRIIAGPSGIIPAGLTNRRR